MERRKIILDVDTGSDDAIAIATALVSPELDVLGICTVGGNVEVKDTTDNTLRVVECCGAQDRVKVYRGAALPLASTLQPWVIQARELPRIEGVKNQETAVHTDHLPLPPATTKPREASAVVWLINTLLAADDGEITLVPVGPITNIALALRADERIIPKIKEIVMMGGTHNVYATTQAAEFNVWCDPEALEIVLQSGIKVTMVSLDATSHACLTRQQAENIRGIGTKPANLRADLILHRIKASYAEGDTYGTGVGVALHDPLAVCSLIHPEVLEDVEYVSCHVDLGHGYAYGETVINRNYENCPTPKNCYYAKSANSDIFYKWLYDTLNRQGK